MNLQEQMSVTKEALFNAFKENELEALLDDKKAEILCRFADTLIKTNKTTNLTAITSPNEIILKHFVDCASISPYIPSNSSVIDVGCGAGFPSIPLAIVRPDLIITPLDSTGKKIDFVTHAAKALDLTNVTPICGRAEELPDLREKFDVCTSRAVARLNVLAELCIPFVKKGGIFITMKSTKGSEEHEEAYSGIKKLGAELCTSSHDSFSFEGINISRELYVYQKVLPTPTQYPRKYSQILKKPL